MVVRRSLEWGIFVVARSNPISILNSFADDSATAPAMASSLPGIRKTVVIFNCSLVGVDKMASVP